RQPVVHGPWRGLFLPRFGDLKIREPLTALRARDHVLLQRDSLSEPEVPVEEHGERLASVLTIHDEGHPRSLVEHDTPEGGEAEEFRGYDGLELAGCAGSVWPSIRALFRLRQLDGHVNGVGQVRATRFHPPRADLRETAGELGVARARDHGD